MSSPRKMASMPFISIPADIKKQQAGLIKDIYANLYQYPNYPAEQFDAKALNSKVRHELTMGDLHANHLLMFYQLLRHGVLSLQEKDYDRFLVLFIKNDPLIFTEIEELKKIINKATPTGATPLLRYIGDEFGDRVGNDDFILEIYIKLNKSNIPFESLMSNHTLYLIKAIEEFRELDKYINDEKGALEKISKIVDPNSRDRKQKKLSAYFENAICSDSSPGLFFSNTSTEFCSSMYQLQINICLEAKQKIKGNGNPTYQEVWNEMRNWVNKFQENFIPKLKLFSYTLSSDHNSICMYSHAPADQRTVLAAAVKLGIKKVGNRELKEFITIENNCPLQDAQAIIDLINCDSYPTDEKEVANNMRVAKNINVEMKPSELAACIDLINQEFSKKAQAGELSNLIQSDPNATRESTGINPILYPFDFALWNREYPILKRCAQKTIQGITYGYSYVHGHDSKNKNQDQDQNNAISLDNDFGKEKKHLIARVYQGSSYQTLYSQHYPAPVLAVELKPDIKPIDTKPINPREVKTKATLPIPKTTGNAPKTAAKDIGRKPESFSLGNLFLTLINWWSLVCGYGEIKPATTLKENKSPQVRAKPSLLSENKTEKVTNCPSTLYSRKASSSSSPLFIGEVKMSDGSRVLAPPSLL